MFPFWIESFPAEQVAPDDQFAVAVRDGRVWAIPLDGAPAPRGRVQMRHYCSAYREKKLMQGLEHVSVSEDLFSGAS